MAGFCVSTIVLNLFSRCNQQFQHLDGRVADDCARTEDGHSAGIVEELVVLRGNHASHGDHDVGTTQLLELGDDLRHEGLVTCSQRTHAQDVDVVLDGLLGRLGGRLEQRTHVDVEADVGIAGGNHLGATVVAVLTHLGDHDTRTTALHLGELVGLGHCLGKSCIVFRFHRIYS